ncbi:uncharacterized protein LOC128299039 [Anopheles moucheti]|uniref:uncharacterized protein LOC128299039 n=1 Tax=Anopheles moucheti TaxID=186751 RepID=UPI0022F0AD0A|nr:uncharacterized protein LOC128299039 [Anopheles moucheti]
MVSSRFVWVACLVCISDISSATGGRKTTSLLSDVCSTKYEPSVHGTREEYYNRVRNDPDKHISARLLRYLIFGGILQAISEKTKIPRSELVKGGAVQFQDHNSKTPGTQASHIIRVGAISKKLQEESPTLNKALENYIGHTQIVPTNINVWHGIGGAIDKYQSSNLTILARIDFNGENLDSSDNDLTLLRNNFFDVIDKYSNAISSADSNINQLNEDRDTVYLIDECMMYDEGKKGYEMVKSGQFESHYNKIWIPPLELGMAFLRVALVVCLVCISAFHLTAGARQKSQPIADICSTSFSDGPFETIEQYRQRVRDPDQHISARLVRYFRFAGILQAISETTEIPRDELVADGASQFQDQSSGRGQTIHAAHIIRVGAINEDLKTKSPSLNKALKNFIGHTQNVLRAANVWHGVGGEIDKYQSEQLGVTASIDFAGTLVTNDRRTVETMITGFRAIIDKYVHDGTHSNDNLKILNADNVIVYCVTPLMLHEEGNFGYNWVKNGEFVNLYGK